MKRKLSLLLVLALVISLVPMSVFAASDNSVTKVVTVKDGADLGAGDNNADAPYLKIKNDEGDWGKEEKITLRLKNAEWLSADDGVDVTIVSFVYGDVDAQVKADSFKRADTKVEFVVVSKDGNEIAKDTVVKVRLLTEVQEEGIATVSVESNTGSITEDSYKFAVGATGSTTVTIEDTVNFSDIADVKEIEIRETAEGAIVAKDLEWVKVELNTKGFTFKKAGKAESDLFNDVAAAYDDGDDDTTLYFDFENATKKPAPVGRQTIDISGIQIEAGRDAEEGNVFVTLKSNIDEINNTKLEIGEFAEYKVEVKADGDAKEIFAGRYEDVTELTNADGDVIGAESTGDAHELQKLIIEEKVEKSWDDERTVTVEFPSWVKVIGVDITGDYTDYTIDENEFDFTPAVATDNTKKVELTFYVSVEAGKTGDIAAKVESRGLDEDYEVVLGKAKAAVEVTAEVAKIKAGVRKQEIGTITITETEEEAIITDGTIVLELSDDDMEWDGTPDVEVVEGDLEIDEDDIDVTDNVLTITVTDESTEASTIVIKNATVELDRSISEGAITVEVKGSALVRNNTVTGDANDALAAGDLLKDVAKSDQLDDYAVFSTSAVAELEVANVITPADADTKVAEAAKFVIGNAEYQVGEEVKTADVAPYVKDGRTMLSVRYVAEAMGVASDNIMWDQATQTVTIFKGDRVAQVTIGSNKLMVGGVAIAMDTVAEIKDGRTMLPVSFVAKALGAGVEWDGATRTVTIK